MMLKHKELEMILIGKIYIFIIRLSFTIMMVMDLSKYTMPFEELEEGKVN